MDTGVHGDIGRLAFRGRTLLKFGMDAYHVVSKVYKYQYLRD